VVTLLKAGNSTSCPWDLGEFGGAAHYVSHWSGLADGGAGRCFPAGHAASGFSFVGGYFAFLRVDPQQARLWLQAACGSGLLLGLAQQWRGAHFMSHTLWTAVLCWCTALAIDATWPARTEL
jgi:membrane-associated PAP2 superfamily phosphatase